MTEVVGAERAIPALLALVRAEYPDRPLAELARVYAGVSDPSTLDALRELELRPEPLDGRGDDPL
jgi:hypothetical protein